MNIQPHKTITEIIIELDKMKAPMTCHRNHADVTEYLAKSYIAHIEELRTKGFPEAANHFKKWYDDFAREQQERYGQLLEGATVHKGRSDYK